MSASLKEVLSPLFDFLTCSTPDSWVNKALQHLDVLLIDHANCEMKAASTAMSLIYRHPEKKELVDKMSPLAREELLHFEKVNKVMAERGVEYCFLSPSRYASRLIGAIDKKSSNRLIDQLIIGSIIEARSCERFYALIPHLDNEIATFYSSLVKSEARHFEDYLQLARLYAKESIEEKITFYLSIESELILSSDSEFRFHSGIPN